MRCPFCSKLDNKVIDSRLSQAGEVTRRRRECEGCGRRYTTYERVEQQVPLIVKKDGRRQPFQRQKALDGLRRACVKRPVSAESLDRLMANVERRLAETGEAEVGSAMVGDLLLAELRELDEVAYVRFASVYREFTDAQHFLAVLGELAAAGPTLELSGEPAPGPEAS